MGTTIFLPLDVPESGGDTLYLSTTAAYNALSPSFRETLEGKYATHSGFSQAAVSDHRERYIREPIETVHPVVRVHPVSICYIYRRQHIHLISRVGYQNQVSLRE
jgi:alpha-ketoglutarate-dependent taurine dioxygenase